MKAYRIHAELQKDVHVPKQKNLIIIDLPLPTTQALRNTW